MTLEEAMVAVWRGALVEDKAEVELGGQRFRVRATQKRHLREIDFVFDGQSFRGLEQNPKTESRWAQLAREGHKVMQFLDAGRYVATWWTAKSHCMDGRKEAGGSALEN